MRDSATEIANLLYRYAELIDGGDLESTAALFRHARLKVRGGGEPIDEAGILALWRANVRIYPCGTPRTKHLVTNPIIEVDEAAGTATARSYYTVYQAAEGFPLQLIASGRYHDRFELADGVWRFAFRDYSLLDLAGDLSAHLTMKVNV
ncbi:nuclear transport factor 2 family protein [Sphingomonas sp. KC8]|uniref:nuclear transport factor 2 family protein n=1 Tax=Sphingomonas sp. KC8 TaxID=1030157 RepID=UPI0002EBFE00|nr:nuclear transport factor 2 family protein [Sphingomonas sp. KC8]ARS29200.1 dioxygenase [Sphingomonas sp. KC8]